MIFPTVGAFHLMASHVTNRSYSFNLFICCSVGTKMAALDIPADIGKQVQTGCGGEYHYSGEGEGRTYVGRSMCIVTVYSVPYKM